jgi:hypothetical protein
LSFTTGRKRVTAARRHWRSSTGRLHPGERVHPKSVLPQSCRRCHRRTRRSRGPETSHRLMRLAGGDFRVGEHPKAGTRRIVEPGSSTVVAITGLVGIYNRGTPRPSLVFHGPVGVSCTDAWKTLG